jgi:VCBS repeat-containing protein
VTLSAGGGTGVYQYSKDGGVTFSASNSFGNLVAGTYSFIVKDANACETNIAVSITEPDLLTLSSSKTDILCYGGTSTVTLSAGGGTGVYQYSKDGGATFSASNSFSNLVAGNYSFIVKDANACSVSINVAITEPATLSIIENHIDVLCFGSNTGKINLNITGGYAPYIYQWSNGNGTKDLDNLIAGVYTVLVTDANNCSISKSITISSPASPLSIKETHQNNICFGDVNGKINITISGGTAPYSHIWSNGAKSKDLSGLSSGTYELLVTDKNNCNATIRVTITPLVKFSINEQLKQVSCFGEKNGKITLELTGGEAPYDIKWSNKLTGKKIENLAAGSYTYIAKDALGCEIAGVIKITEPLTISSQITVKNSTCKFSPDGAILIEVKGGTAPYQFYWNGFDRGANNSLLNIAPGKYTVNIIDANNCSKQIITEVLPGNCAPNANDDAYTTNEDTPITILTPGIIINDLDPDDDDLIISLASVKDPDMQNGSTTGSNTSFKTKNGFVTLNQNGSFTYTPNKNFYGVENFIYKVTDGALNSNLAIVTIRVNAVNDPPIAQNDFYTTLEDVPVNGSVAPNDSDPENEPLSFTLVVPPARGTLVFKADGTFIYTPEKDFNGVITFNYQVCDPQGLCDQAVATITITPVNDPPIAVDDQFYLQRNLQISASVAPNDSEPDGDPTTFTLLTQPKNGTLVFNANGTFTYQPNNGFKGTDTFNYRICDPFGLCDNAVVDLIIQPLVTVKLTPANGIINEGENINITAELTESIFQDVTITIQFNGSAINDTDYKLTGNYQQITISAGQTTTTQKFNIAALLDDTRDDNEHVIASISSTSSPAFVNIGTGSEVIIKDIYPESIPSLPTENPDINPDPLTSPNGDGNGNDSFIIYNINNYPNNEVIIFNRWGNEVYRTKNYNNRDNSFRGVANVGILTNSKKELVDGVYYYIIYTTQNGEKKMNKGYLILKR